MSPGIVLMILTDPANCPCFAPRQVRRATETNELRTTCRRCLQERWRTAALAQDDTCRFLGFCGADNLCGSLQRAGLRPLTLVLQSRISDRNAPSTKIPHSCLRVSEDRTFSVASSKVFTDVNIERAETLLRLVFRHLQEASHAHRVESDLQYARLRIPPHDGIGEEPLRKDQSYVGVGCSAATVRTSSFHVQQIVQMVLDYIHRHYQHPMALHEVAAELKMNANYLSDLFSKTMQVTFHRYIEALRLAKAQELLSNPCIRVSEVAYAVGYSNPNHFRTVFKIHEGIPPSAWRNTSGSAGRALKRESSSFENRCSPAEAPSRGERISFYRAGYINSKIELRNSRKTRKGKPSYGLGTVTDQVDRL